MNQPWADGIFWIAALACVIAEVAILRSTYVARRVEKSELVPASSGGGEVIWAIIPALALAALLIFTWQKMRARDAHHGMMDHSGMIAPMQMPHANPSASQR